MVTTATSYTDSRNRAYPGEGYDGVVRVSNDNYYGTGVLLYDGRAVLTAAHLFSGRSSSATVYFETTNGPETLVSNRVLLNPFYTSESDHDLALVWLSNSAPLAAERYGIYRGADEIGQVFDFVGYGRPGTGSSGVLTNYSGSPLRLKAGNLFDTDASTLKSFMGSVMDWTPAVGTQLIADFDNGTATNDALGRLMSSHDVGLGLVEGMISSGDSGGPAFINGLVAGIASYTASLSKGWVEPDIDAILNSSYGEIAAWQRVSHYQQWIDQSLRAQLPNAPNKPEDVKKEVAEGNHGTTYAYFLLQFTGVRADPDQLLSVDYSTVDGTATGGNDYIPAAGKLILYPDENHAVIPVEIIGDTVPEPDENFYLEVFSPVGGSFGTGVIKLTAVRTILDDDGWLV